MGVTIDPGGNATSSLGRSNGVDDTATIQAALDQGGAIAGKPGETYLISDALVISSDTTLDVRGCTVQLLAGSDSNMLRNDATLGVGDRDTDIKVIGGIWDRQANAGTGSALHSLVFHRVDRVSVVDVEVRSTSGKYAVLFSDVTDFTCDGALFDTASDGVHVQGPAARGTIRSIQGDCGDDMVALTGQDYAAYEMTDGGGNIAQVLIDSVNGTTVKQLVKILPGAGLTASNITVRGVKGMAGTHAVSLFSDTGDAATTGGTVSGITIEDVDATPTLNLVYINVTTAQAVKIASLTNRSLAAGNRSVAVDSPSTIASLIVRDVAIPGAYDTNVVNVASGATVTNLLVDGIQLPAASTNARALNCSGTITRGVLSKVHQIGGNAVVFNNGTLSALELSEVDCTSSYVVRHSGATAMVLDVDKIAWTGGNGLVRVDGSTGCSATIRGGIIRTDSAAVTRSSTQTVRVNGRMIRCDVSILTPSAGDIAHNTNGALACGTGPVVSNGTLWKHLYTGAATT